MRLRGRTVVLVAASGLGACGDKDSGACATRVTREVCEAPANLRGAEPVPQTRITAPAPQLVAEPLLDGRYVQTALTLYCEEDFRPSMDGIDAQGLVEISGCVMRLTIVYPGFEQPFVDVLTFRYAEDGTLESTSACSGDPTPIHGRQHGFDGTTLQFMNSVEETGSDGQVHTCERIDSFELR